MSWIKKKLYQVLSATKQDILNNSSGLSTLVLSSFKRINNVHKIVEEYTKYSIFDEIIIWHNGPEKLVLDKEYEKLKIIQSDDLGLSSRYAAGLLASSEVVFFQDDDLIVPESGFAKLLSEQQKEPGRTYCIEGKVPYKDGTYGKAIKPAPDEQKDCEIHLNRLICTSKKWIPYYFSFWYKTNLNVSPSAGGGEDIIFSYAVYQQSGLRPLCVGVAFKNLDSANAISNRQGNQHANRTEIMKVCQSIVSR